MTTTEKSVANVKERTRFTVYVMKNSIFIVIILFVSFSCSTSFPKEIDEVITNCDSETVYLAILKSPSLNQTFPDAVFSKFYNQKEHAFFFGNNDVYREFRKSVASHVKSAGNKDDVIKILNTWCEANIFLDSLANASESPSEAILYDDSVTAYIIKRHLAPQRADQNWASLSTYQLYETNVDFMKHVETLSNIQKQRLFAELRAIAKKKRMETP